jgi:hypothetical protein
MTRIATAIATAEASRRGICSLSKQQFRDRFFARFYDPAFDAVASEFEKVFEKAWDGYIAYRRTPGENSKTRRLAQAAQSAIEARGGYEVDFLDLSTLADEPLKVIYPCKACVSTSMPLCHWPCSCYPNHALGQTNDWMAEIGRAFAIAAHGDAAGPRDA